MNRFRLAIYVAGLLGAIALVQCGRGVQRSSSLSLKGSDTMVILGQRWAEKFMATHPGAVIQVTGGGSGTGIAALINGTTDICQSSRPMKEAEKKQMREKYGAEPVEIVVARDGLAVYLNSGNPILELTIDQLKSIYTGAVTQWKAVGGPDAPITVYGRENSSGTYSYFKEHVLGGADFAATVQTLPGTAAVVSAVAQDPNGIGYGGAAYAKGVKECAVRTDAGQPAVLPSRETVLDGSYPISRGLFYYLRKAPEGRGKEFVDYVLSPEGQQIVTEVGYFPVR